MDLNHQAAVLQVGSEILDLPPVILFTDDVPRCLSGDALFRDRLANFFEEASGIYTGEDYQRACIVALLI